MEQPLSISNSILRDETFHALRTAAVMLDFAKCRCLLTAQQRFAVLQCAGPFGCRLGKSSLHRISTSRGENSTGWAKFDVNG